MIAAGCRPGPSFKGWIDLAMDAQLEGRVTSTEEALALVRPTLHGDAEKRG